MRFMGVYCTAWTYFGSVGRAASAGVWFLPIYLGPTLAMVLGWVVLRKMVRIAKTYRITTIADFVVSRYGKSPLLAGAVTLITLVGILPYIALQLKAVSVAFSVMTGASGSSPLAAAPCVVGRQPRCSTSRWCWRVSPWCLVPGTWTTPSATRAW